jgi:hypothetical protein
MSPGSGHGDHAIPATGASGGVPALRYKISHWRKMLILRTKQSISRILRYKRSYWRNPLS